MSSVVRALFVTVLLLGCQPATEPTVEALPPHGQPHILVDDGDRGVDTLLLSLTGSAGEDVRRTVRLINTGHGALELTQVSTFTGLVRAPGFLDEATPDFEVGLPLRPIASGAWVTVPVVFHARRGGASVASRLELRFGGGQVLVLSLVGDVLRSDCITAADVDFGSARVGERLERVITLHNPAAGDQLVQLGRFVDERGMFDFSKPSELVRVPANSDVRLPVAWAPRFTGEHGATLELSSLRCLPSRVTLRGSAWVLEALEGPSTLDFGSVEPLTRAAASVLVRNTLPRSVNLRATVEFGDGFALVPGQALTIPAAVHERPGEWRTHSIEVFVEVAPRRHGPHRAQLTLRDDDARAWLTVSLKAEAGPEQVIVEPAEVRFEQVAVFQGSLHRSVREAVIRNESTEPLQLGAPAIVGSAELCVGEVDDAGLCAPSLPAIIAPGAQLRLPLTLSLAGGDPGGTKAWQVAIPSSHAMTPTVALQVTAEPVQVPPCLLQVTTSVGGQPTQGLDFGKPPMNAWQSGAVSLCNLAPTSARGDVCLVDSFRLRAANSSFAVNVGPSGVVLVPGQCTQLALRAMAPGVGVATGELEFMTSRPQQPKVRLPLRVEAR
ncbi:MAG: hypothetical protein JNM69_18920 [Archangium sp.]|nr:hypothetical protein [Archangium sp.]